MARFADVIGTHPFGVDVLTGETVNLTSPVRMAPRGVYVLELK